MKRRFSALLLVLIMCMSVFTGCALVERNSKAYFEAVVATIEYKDGKKENVSKRDLITGFNSYGYNYIDNYGYSREKAFKTTLETIINKRISIKVVEQFYKDKNEKMLNERETTYIWDKTFESIQDNFKTQYYYKVIDYKPGENKKSEEETKLVYKPFESSVYVENGIIKNKQPVQTIRDTYEAKMNTNNVFFDYEYKDESGKQIFKDAMYTLLYAPIIANDENAKDWKNAFDNYIQDIKDNFDYIDFKDNKDCFYFEMDRIYNIVRDNYIVEKYSIIFNEQKQQGADVSVVTIDDVLKNYSRKVRADYTKYVVEDNASSFESDIISKPGEVDYIVDSTNASKFFNVGYIKLQLNETQKKFLEEKKAERDSNSISVNEYNAAVEDVFNSVYTYQRDEKTGEKTETKVFANKSLVEDIRNKIDIAGDYGDNSDINREISYRKAEAFRDFMYYVNDDDSVKNAEYSPVMGINKNNEILANSTIMDNFKDEDNKAGLKDAILTLYNYGNAKVGDTTELVRSDDGYYLFFYAGKVENLFGGIDGEFEAPEEGFSVLASTRLSIFSEKTLFDKIFESMNKDYSYIFENMNVNHARSKKYTNNIEGIENNLKDLYK